MKIFAERLKELRTEKNLSIRKLAEKLDISASVLSAYEADKSEATGPMIIKLAEFYGVTADYLLGLEL